MIVLHFFLKEIRFFKYAYDYSNNFFNSYPITFFENSSIYNIFIILGNSFYGVFITEYYFGYISFTKLISLISIAFILTIIFTILGLILWKYGLKRYEAFG